MNGFKNHLHCRDRYPYNMIFLAVTMGFFAESVREHIRDKKHIKQLTTSLVSELKHDTSQLDFLIIANERRRRKIDNLFFHLQRSIDGIDT